MSVTDTQQKIAYSSWSTTGVGGLLLGRVARSQHTAPGRAKTTKTAIPIRQDAPPQLCRRNATRTRIQCGNALSCLVDIAAAMRLT